MRIATAVLPQQAALRRAGHLPAPPQPRADRARPQRRGVLRAALPRARRGRDAHQGPEPGPLPRARPVPGAQARGVPRPRRRRGVRSPCARPGFPEPKTFSTRVAKLLQERADDFDIVHDNQVLGYGMLEIEKMGLPLVTTIHHPITFDRRIDIAADQEPVAQAHAEPLVRLPADAGPRSPGRRAVIITPSETSKRDIAKDFGVDPARMQVILLGVDDDFVPPTAPARARPDPGHGQRRRPDEGHRDPARGVRQAPHRARPRADPGHQAEARRPTEKLIDKLSISDSVRFVHGISDAELVELMGSAEIACVPSPLRGLLAAHRRADGVRDAAGRLPRRRDPRGGRARRRTPPTLVDPGRRRRARRGHRQPARRPRATRAPGRRRPPARRRAVQLAGRRRDRGRRPTRRSIADYQGGTRRADR